MNDWDRNNFLYMQSLSMDEFEQWINEIPTDEVDYAISLYQLARSELTVREIEVFDDVPHVDDARAVLSRIACK